MTATEKNQPPSPIGDHAPTKIIQALGLALGSAVLYIVCFPNFNLSFAGWVALVPLILLTYRKSPRQAFVWGWLTGALAYMGILYWLLVTFRTAQQSLGLAFVSLVLLAGYLGLFWGAWAGIVAASGSTPGMTDQQGHVLPILAAATWVALEYLRAYLFSGFPWAMFGDSQWRHLDLIQIASATGVYGVSFLLVFINASIALFLLKRLRPVMAATAIAFLASSLLFGLKTVQPLGENGNRKFLKVALLQGSIDQYQKWDTSYVRGIENTYQELVNKANHAKPDIIIWPETSVPGYLLQDPPLHSWLTGVVERSKTYHLLGAPTMPSRGTAYNSAFLLDPQGNILAQYDKQHLVPFGEIVPFSGILGRWIHVLNDLGGFTAGHRSPVLTSPFGPIGVNICYEAIFPHLVRQSAARGAALLVNLTNDGWYMRTAAPYQHFVPNVFRAVENRRWVLRADNTGVSAIIDPWGRVVAASPIFIPTVVEGEVRLRNDLTLYSRYGDVFAWGCILLSLLICLRKCHCAKFVRR